MSTTPAGLFTYLDVSTSHITQKDIDTLQDGAPTIEDGAPTIEDTDETEARYRLPLTIAAYPAGLFVYLPEPEVLAEDLKTLEDVYDISPHLGEVLRYAQNIGAYIVRFDRDGVVHEGLWIREEDR